MYIILGGTGRVGSAVARALLAQGAAVTVVGHDPAKAEAWKSRGAQYASVDIREVESLRKVFRSGRRAFLLNPPSAPSTDTDVEERRTMSAILAALDGSALERVVAQSTYGAKPGERVGDLSTLYELEQGLADCDIPVTIQRAAYFFSNWDTALESAVKRGIVESFYPEDFILPMVAPEDLGRSAARLLAEPATRSGVLYVEGPKRYTPADVAEAFAQALGKTVRVVQIPKAQWIERYRSMGFSPAAADSYARMTALTLAGPQMPADPIRGDTSLSAYVAALVQSKRTV